MGGTQTIIEPTLQTAPASGSCPCCDEPWGGLPHAETRYFPDTPLRRCLRCGARFVAEAAPARLLVSCCTCSLPFLTSEYEQPTNQQCNDCRSGQLPADLSDETVTSAAEDEVLSAIDEDCSFLISAPLSEYLNRVARAVAREIDGAPINPEGVLIEDPGVRTLALPSGFVALSVGAIASVEDEAELAFMIGHELAHATRGDAAIRLVRQGLLNLARTEESVGDVWRASVEDMLSLGYDPSSALRWLARLDRRMSDADANLRTYFLSHPTPCQRQRRAQQLLTTQVDPVGTRCNRVVFRRAAGREVLSTVLERVDRLADARSGRRGESEPAAPRRRLHPLWLLAAGAAATATVALLVRLLG